ncbi:MAG: hypothetical protein LKE30_05115 [Bacteroidales bacterium]|jgi:hypothetical protein|nr:hypothetical protein [Bacteroidales bacterium]
MKNDYRKIYWIITIVWAIIASICSVGYALTFKQDAITQQPIASTFWNIAYWSSVIFCILAIVTAICFAIIQIVTGLRDDWKKQIGIIIGIISLVEIFAVSYLVASGTDISQAIFDKTGSSYSNSRLIGAGLYMVYILFACVIISVLYSEIAKKIK